MANPSGRIAHGRRAIFVKERGQSQDEYRPSWARVGGQTHSEDGHPPPRRKVVVNENMTAQERAQRERECTAELNAQAEHRRQARLLGRAPNRRAAPSAQFREDFNDPNHPPHNRSISEPPYGASAAGPLRPYENASQPHPPHFAPYAPHGSSASGTEMLTHSPHAIAAPTPGRAVGPQVPSHHHYHHSQVYEAPSEPYQRAPPGGGSQNALGGALPSSYSSLAGQAPSGYRNATIHNRHPATAVYANTHPTTQHPTQHATSQNHTGYAAELAMQIEEKRQRKEREKLEERMWNEKIEREAQDFNPWGRGGSGAPMRDTSGTILTNRKDLVERRQRELQHDNASPHPSNPHGSHLSPIPESKRAPGPARLRVDVNAYPSQERLLMGGPIPPTRLPTHGHLPASGSTGGLQPPSPVDQPRSPASSSGSPGRHSRFRFENASPERRAEILRKQREQEEMQRILREQVEEKKRRKAEAEAYERQREAELEAKIQRDLAEMQGRLLGGAPTVQQRRQPQPQPQPQGRGRGPQPRSVSNSDSPQTFAERGFQAQLPPGGSHSLQQQQQLGAPHPHPHQGQQHAPTGVPHARAPSGPVSGIPAGPYHQPYPQGAVHGQGPQSSYQNPSMSRTQGLGHGDEGTGSGPTLEDGQHSVPQQQQQGFVPPQGSQPQQHPQHQPQHSQGQKFGATGDFAAQWASGQTGPVQRSVINEPEGYELLKDVASLYRELLDDQRQLRKTVETHLLTQIPPSQPQQRGRRSGGGGNGGSRLGNSGGVGAGNSGVVRGAREKQRKTGAVGSGASSRPGGGRGDSGSRPGVGGGGEDGWRSRELPVDAPIHDNKGSERWVPVRFTPPTYSSAGGGAAPGAAGSVGRQSFKSGPKASKSVGVRKKPLGGSRRGSGGLATTIDQTTVGREQATGGNAASTAEPVGSSTAGESLTGLLAGGAPVVVVHDTSS